MPAAPRYVSKLKDARCIVIGGTSGIGLSVAEALVEEGARVYIASSSQDKVQAAVARLSDPQQVYNAVADPERINGSTVDMNDLEHTEENIRKLFASIPKSWDGKVDHVINTAGTMPPPLALKDTTATDVANLTHARFTSSFLLSKVAFEHLDQNGSIVLTSGVIVRLPFPGGAVGSGVASALEGLVKGLAIDLGSDERHIRVNLVLPGPVQTPLMGKISDNVPSAFIESMKSKTLFKQFPSSEEVAQSYIGALKDGSLTGQSIFSESGTLISANTL